MQVNVLREIVGGALRESADLRLRLIEEHTDTIIRASQAIHDCLAGAGKLLLFGNGGSAADAQHIAAELVCRFNRERRPLPAIALTTDTSALTAIGNDYGFERIFARQIEALCQPHDIVMAISTSGRSPNVLAGIEAARTCGARTIGLTGGDGGRIPELVEIPITIPSDSTARIQECHIAVGHIICEIVETLLRV